MRGPRANRFWVGLALAAWAALALGLWGCSSEDESPAARQATAPARAQASATASSSVTGPVPVPKPPAPGQEPGALLEQARQALVLGHDRQALAEVEAAAQALWQRLPLELAQAILVSEPAKGYGIYQTRQDNVYLVASPERPVFPGKGQPMYIYLEPVGYKVEHLAGDKVGISLAMDVDLFDGQGKQLFSKKDFMRSQTVSHHFNREFFLNVTVNLKGAPPGAYQLRLTLKDLVGKQETVATLPVRLAMAPLEK